MELEKHLTLLWVLCLHFCSTFSMRRRYAEGFTSYGEYLKGSSSRSFANKARSLFPYRSFGYDEVTKIVPSVYNVKAGSVHDLQSADSWDDLKWVVLIGRKPNKKKERKYPKPKRFHRSKTVYEKKNFKVPDVSKFDEFTSELYEGPAPKFIGSHISKPFNIPKPKLFFNSVPKGFNSPLSIESPRSKPFDIPSLKPFDSPDSKLFDIPNLTPFDSPNVKPFDTPSLKPFDTPSLKPIDNVGSKPFDTPSSKPFGTPNSKSFVRPVSKDLYSPVLEKDFDTPSSKDFQIPGSIALDAPGPKVYDAPIPSAYESYVGADSGSSEEGLHKIAGPPYHDSLPSNISEIAKEIFDSSPDKKKPQQEEEFAPSLQFIPYRSSTNVREVVSAEGTTFKRETSATARTPIKYRPIPKRRTESRAIDTLRSAAVSGKFTGKPAYTFDIGDAIQKEPPRIRKLSSRKYTLSKRAAVQEPASEEQIIYATVGYPNENWQIINTRSLS